MIQTLDLLWKGQFCHAGSPNSRQVTQAEAEAAVHMAVALSQWLTAGVLHRKLQAVGTTTRYKCN